MIRIWVVDDDPAVQVMIAEFKSEEFDLQLLDILMPGMDGLETMPMVRQARPALPIIVVSGRPAADEAGLEPSGQSMATKRSATYSLPRRFDAAALLSMVAQCLKGETQASPTRDHNVASGRR